MRHVGRIALGCLWLLCWTAVPVAAADPGPKIGVVDLQRALTESEAGKQAKAQLSQLEQTKRALVDRKAKEVETLKRELEIQGKLLKEEVRREKERRLEREIKALQRLARDSQEELQRQERELIERIIKALVQIVKAIGKEEGYTLILERGGLERGGGWVVFAGPAVDLTDKVIARYNQQSKAKEKK